MSGCLLDTNILSELRRPEPERKIESFVAAQPLDKLYVSTVTFAPIRFGIELVTGAARRAALQDWLMHKVRPMFEQRTDYERAGVPLFNPWTDQLPDERRR